MTPRNEEDLKLWWSGDSRVEPYMSEIVKALKRSGLEGEKRTDVYNRAYKAVYKMLKDCETKQAIGAKI